MVFDLIELPWPINNVEERPEIVTVVVRILQDHELLGRRGVCFRHSEEGGLT